MIQVSRARSYRQRHAHDQPRPCCAVRTPAVFALTGPRHPEESIFSRDGKTHSSQEAYHEPAGKSRPSDNPVTPIIGRESSDGRRDCTVQPSRAPCRDISLEAGVANKKRDGDLALPHGYRTTCLPATCVVSSPGPGAFFICGAAGRQSVSQAVCNKEGARKCGCLRSS